MLPTAKRTQVRVAMKEKPHVEPQINNSRYRMRSGVREPFILPHAAFDDDGKAGNTRDD